VSVEQRPVASETCLILRRKSADEPKVEDALLVMSVGNSNLDGELLEESSCVFSVLPRHPAVAYQALPAPSASFPCLSLQRRMLYSSPMSRTRAEKYSQSSRTIIEDSDP
jgi:hypothetical protein